MHVKEHVHLIKINKNHFQNESAKLRAMRANIVVLCQRPLRANVLTCQRPLRAYVLMGECVILNNANSYIIHIC